MKTVVKTDHLINLEVKTTNQSKRDFLLPIENLHFWYPFNVNFSYVYSDARDQLYLVKENDYKGTNWYGTDVLKQTDPLEEMDGFMFHEKVYDRNMYIMLRAHFIGLPKIITDEYTLEDIEEAYKHLHTVHYQAKCRIEERVVEKAADIYFPTTTCDPYWDTLVYEETTEEEKEFLEELGEMYGMLGLMRKIAESR
jgi:hypothetical protein